MLTVHSLEFLWNFGRIPHDKRDVTSHVLPYFAAIYAANEELIQRGISVSMTLKTGSKVKLLDFTMVNENTMLAKVMTPNPNEFKGGYLELVDHLRLEIVSVNWTPPVEEPKAEGEQKPSDQRRDRAPTSKRGIGESPDRLDRSMFDDTELDYLVTLYEGAKDRVVDVFTARMKDPYFQPKQFGVGSFVYRLGEHDQFTAVAEVKAVGLKEIPSNSGMHVLDIGVSPLFGRQAGGIVKVFSGNYGNHLEWKNSLKGNHGRPMPRVEPTGEELRFINAVAIFLENLDTNDERGFDYGNNRRGGHY